MDVEIASMTNSEIVHNLLLAVEKNDWSRVSLFAEEADERGIEHRVIYTESKGSNVRKYPEIPE